MKLFLLLILLLTGCAGRYDGVPLMITESRKAFEAEMAQSQKMYEERPKLDTYMRASDENLTVEIQMAYQTEFKLIISNNRDKVTVVTDLSAFVRNVLVVEGKEYITEDVVPMVFNVVGWKQHEQERILMVPRGSISRDYKIPTMVNNLDDVVFMVGYENGGETAYVVVTTADIVVR